MEPKIIVAPDFADKIRPQVEKLGFTVVKSLDELSKEKLQYVEAVIGTPPKDKLKLLPNLRWLQLNSAGTNGYENPLLYADPGELLITSAIGVYSIPIAEYTIGAMILMSKKALANNLCTRLWHKRLRIDAESDIELSISNVAIWGTGNIGTTLGKMLRGLGCQNIIGINRQGRSAQYFDSTYSLSESVAVIRESDYIISVMPENSDSIGFWNLSKFSEMKKRCIFINVGRGSAVVQRDLIKALNNKMLSGAVLDVSDPDPIPLYSILRNVNRLLLTNHASYFSNLNSERFEKLVFEQLEKYLTGEELCGRCILE